MLRRLSLACLTLLASALIFADDDVKPAVDGQRAAQQEQLSKLQKLVGSWRGVGQPQRGSTKGSWIETANWAWKFSEKSAALAVNVADGKYFSTAELHSGEKPDEFVLLAKTTDGKGEVSYAGTVDKDERLLLVAKEPPAGMPTRVSLRLVAGGDRLLVLLEGPSSIGVGYTRLAEVGYTRKGSGFGQGAAGPECVVTGGVGTMEVSYKGQKYYVCCTGCRDYFNDNPEEVLADYKARKEEEKKKKEMLKEQEKG